MITFLLSISFILHIMAFFAIYLLFKQNQQVKQNNPNDMMELFETYLQEIKEENRRLQDELGTGPFSTQYDSPTNEAGSMDTHTQPEGEMKDSVEASQQAKVLQLHFQGFSETEIAQKLNCGKTEAAMIIKLHTKKG